MSLKFGLNLKNKTASGPAKPGAKTLKKKKPLLGDDDEDVPVKPKTTDGAQEIGEFNFDDTLQTSEPSKPAPTKPKKGPPLEPPTRKPLAKPDDPTLLAHSASAKEAEQRALDALKQDAKIYDYDSAYDALHAAKAQQKLAAEADPTLKGPKYMDSLFTAAQQRKTDQLRARDKLLARERENEGDEFADKEKFVTGAYKTAQEEAAKAEEEEKLRVQKEEEDRKKFGMMGFHKKMLEEREREHQMAVEAAEKAIKEGIVVPVGSEEEAKKSELQQVAELRAQGKNIMLNEEGQVADKRQLLSAGLNIVAKPKPVPNAALAARPIPAPPSHAAAKGGRNAMRDRQTAMVAQQIEAAAKRKADEDAEEQSKLLHAAKSQKTATDIMSAKERYLQRKREAAEAKAKAGK
jgi:coiled-coil domain-containing protein 55